MNIRNIVMHYRYVFPPYKIYIDLSDDLKLHGTSFLEHVTIKYVARFL